MQRNELRVRILNEIATGATAQQCAEKYNISAGTIRSWLSRAKAKGEAQSQRNAKPATQPKQECNATQQETEKKNIGRPSKYKDEYAEQAYKLCLLSATDKDLADFFMVEESTINNWKNEHPIFLESIKRGKDAADANVANRLYQRAMGYEHSEDKIFNNNGQALIVPTVKHYPPDSTAAIFWLKNRQRDKWRDKQEVEVSGELNLADKLKAARERANKNK